MPQLLEGQNQSWLGAHLFFDGDIYSAACDRILLDVVAPLVVDLDARWFFIRYSDEGAHVRLRILTTAEQHGDLRSKIEAATEVSPHVEKLLFVAYEPEVERYGGPAGIVLAEDLFHHSSIAALAMLRKIDADPSARLGKALLAMLLQLHLFCDGHAAEIAEAYGTGYLKAQIVDDEIRQQWLTLFEEGANRQGDLLADYVEAAWQALENGDPLTVELDALRVAASSVAEQLRALCANGRLIVDGEICHDWLMVIHWIVSSYLHMMNNRLGVSIRDECYVSVVIHNILAEITARNTVTAQGGEAR